MAQLPSGQKRPHTPLSRSAVRLAYSSVNYNCLRGANEKKSQNLNDYTQRERRQHLKCVERTWTSAQKKEEVGPKYLRIIYLARNREHNL